jgi:hypothetical protein
MMQLEGRLADSEQLCRPNAMLTETLGRRARRYCNADCAAQHWKHHKASCRREVAAKAAGQQQ